MPSPVFDILDCGPNKRFTANGKLVHNCESINQQNLRRGSELRKSLCAPEGQLIYVADSSNIEARVLAWVAGHHDLLQQFRERQDVYSNFAASIYGKPINKYDHPIERFVGKTCVLGLGYGTGWRKLQGSLGTSSTPVYLDDAEAQRIVNLYRAVNAPIQNYWGQANSAIADMYLNNQRQWGTMTIYKNALVMPNGMALQYPRLAINEDDERQGWHYWNGKFMTRLYGAKCVENIVQCLARIILFDQMLQIDQLFRASGGRVILSVHDEVIATAPDFGARLVGTDDRGAETWEHDNDANALFQQMLTIMRTPPAWCPDLPLDGEGGFSQVYSK